MSILINALTGITLKKSSKIIPGEIFDPPSPEYIHTKEGDSLKKVKIKVLVLNQEESKTWQDDVLKQSFENCHKNEDNVNLHFLNYRSEDESYKLLREQNLYAARLFLIKKLINEAFEDNDYIFLINNNFFFISSLNKLIFNEDCCLSYPFDNIEYRNPGQNINESCWSSIVKITHHIDDLVTLYNNKINNTHDINDIYSNIKLYGLPIYIKKSFLSLIIDRWIELTILIGNKMNHIDWLLSLSLVLFEYNYKIDYKNIINICYTTSFLSFVNKNSLLFNYKYKLISHKTKIEIFDIKKYTPWEIITYTPNQLDYKSIEVFIENFNFIVTQKINCLKPQIKNV